MMAATEMTLVTPITIPRMVSAERILRARRVSSATSRFSLMSDPVIYSLRPQRHHRIEPGCFYRGINPKKQPDDRAQDHTEYRDPGLHRRGKARERAQRQRAAEPDHHAHTAT